VNDLQFDVDQIITFLVGLLETPSPLGYTVEAVTYTQQAFAALNIPNITMEVTPKGALLLHWPGRADDAPRGVTAHLDTLGLMVKEIKNDGRLKLTNLGGVTWPAIEMEGVTVRTHDDRRYRGTVLFSNPSTHVNRETHTGKRDAKSMEVRLDIITHSADETRAAGIDVGDFVILDPRVEVTESGFIRSRFLDDKAGVAVIYGAMQAMHNAGLQPAQDTWFLIANYEEVGHGGSAGFPDSLAEVLAVDMGAVGEGQASDEFSVSICVKDASGPYHFEMNNKLRRLAAEHDIPAKVDIYPYYSSDGSAYWRAGGTGRVGLVGPGVDASHAYERTHRDSLHHSAHLIARYLLD